MVLEVFSCSHPTGLRLDHSLGLFLVLKFCECKIRAPVFLTECVRLNRYFLSRYHMPEKCKGYRGEWRVPALQEPTAWSETTTTTEVCIQQGAPGRLERVGSWSVFKKQSLLKDGGTCLNTGWQDCEGEEIPV